MAIDFSVEPEFQTKLAPARGRRAEEWVVRLDPEASDALRLAAILDEARVDRVGPN